MAIMTLQNSNEKQKKLLVPRIISAVLYLLVTAFLVYSLIDSLNSENLSLSIALYLAIIVIIFGSIGYGVCIIFSFVCFIVAIAKRKILAKGTSTYFAIFTILPVLTEFLIIVICKLIA